MVVMANPHQPSTGTWTAYPSLLSELESEEHRNALEEAACAHYCGRYSDAEEIFKNQLPESHTKPILALQHADMYTKQGLEHERIRLLQLALKSAGSDAALDASVKLLMRFMIEDAEMYVHGKLEGVKDLLVEARTHLRPIAIANLSDVQVGSVFPNFMLSG